MQTHNNRSGKENIAYLHHHLCLRYGVLGGFRQSPLTNLTDTLWHNLSKHMHNSSINVVQNIEVAPPPPL